MVELLGPGDYRSSGRQASNQAAALAFVAWLEPLLEHLPKSLAVTDQLDRASASIPLNIAEGNGKFTTAADRCRSFDLARGWALESAAALDVLVAKGRSSEGEVLPGKDRLWSIVSMLVALIRAKPDDRLHEGNPLRLRLRLRLRSTPAKVMKKCCAFSSCS